jgi:hypothetical protein
MTGGALIRFGKISFFSQGTGALKYEATVLIYTHTQIYTRMSYTTVYQDLSWLIHEYQTHHASIAFYTHTHTHTHTKIAQSSNKNLIMQ